MVSFIRQGSVEGAAGPLRVRNDSLRYQNVSSLDFQSIVLVLELGHAHTCKTSFFFSLWKVIISMTDMEHVHTALILKLITDSMRGGGTS